MKRFTAITVFVVLCQFVSSGQSRPFVSHPSQLNDPAFAEWIVPEENYGAFLFRKTFDMTDVPDNFMVHVSGDARYRLYVNGTRVCWGPAVGDMENWNYETVDIAPFLRTGRNVVASQVWNNGRHNGTKQLSERTAFILQGNSATEQVVNTNSSWKVYRDPGYYPLTMTDRIAGGGFIAPGTDSVVGARHPWGWNTLSFDDSNWARAQEIGKGNHTGLDTWLGTPWKLKPRTVPFMEEKTERIPDLLSVTGIPYTPGIGKKHTFTIPARSGVEILLDNRVLTMGYPQLLVSGGRDSRIEVRYQEGLFDDEGRKGHRDDWEGKNMKGIYDVFMPDGGDRLFEPLWIRVFRYAKITVTTGRSPLTIHDFYNVFTAYPLQENATFDAGNPLLDRIWDAAWRTQRLCALESYWDCPYYEQVQYIGDTRIQAMLTMYIDGDDRLARNAIEQFYNSMQPMGLTKSAHPTSGVQIIPPFSLYLIGMIHDYYMMRDDPEFVRQFIPGINFILNWFISRIADNGMLGPLPYWNHIDGGTDFVFGSPPGVSDGGSAHITLLTAYAMDKAVDMLRTFGFDCEADRYTSISADLKKNTMKLCYSPERNLIAETPEKEQFSQHTNIFAVLTNTFEPELHSQVMQTVLDDSSIIQTTLYFKYYLFQALKKAGMGAKILDLMHHWEFFLEMGFTTFPEHGLHSRSDCHAWAAHPMHAFLSVICGIEPSSPGFKTLEIRPSPGNSNILTGTMPHPMGEIRFQYQKSDQGKDGYNIVLPDGLTGKLLVEDQSIELVSGENKVLLDPN
jgi:alpha-L-rhamnosidase